MKPTVVAMFLLAFAVTAMSGSYQFTNLRDFANLRYQTYTQGFGVPEDTTVSPYYSAFVQDNIRLAPNLSSAWEPKSAIRAILMSRC